MGLLAWLCIQVGLLTRLPDCAELLAVFHGHVGPVVELCNHLWSGKLASYLPLPGGPQAGLHNWTELQVGLCNHYSSGGVSGYAP